MKSLSRWAWPYILRWPSPFMKVLNHGGQSALLSFGKADRKLAAVGFATPHFIVSCMVGLVHVLCFI